MTRVQSLRSFPASAPVADAVVPVPTAARWSREWIYFSCIIVAWCFTPLLRRLLDFRSGAFNPVAVASLIPFVMLVPLAFICFRRERFRRLTPALRWCVYAWCAAFAYAFLIAAAFGSPSAGVFELMQYLTPMLGGVWLAGQDLPPAQALKRLAWIILPCAGGVAIYGIFQWVQPPPWDVMWVVGSQFAAADSPVPFGMRVFSTLNSPGPAADFFALTMIFGLAFFRFHRVWGWALLSALGAALLLTLIREAWVSLVVGAFVYVALSRQRLRVIPAMAVFVVLIGMLVTTLPALLGSGSNSDVLISRLNTFGDVGHDPSALARQNEISDALAEGLNDPVGAGLGNIGVSARLSSNAPSLGTVLDSGYLARFLELGWFGFVCYLMVVVAGPIVVAFVKPRRDRADPVPDDPTVRAQINLVRAVALAMCAALAWSDAANDAHLGLDGFFFWMALGLLSLAGASARVTLPVAVLDKRVRGLARRAS